MAVVEVEQRFGGGVIQIEVDEVAEDTTEDIYGGPTRSVKEKVVRLARPLFSEALDLVGSCAEEVHGKFSAIPEEQRPQEFELHFAVKLDAKAGAKIAEVSTGAQFQVVLRWQSSPAT